ncbi:hypothetical protein CTA1_11791 [Colletotrichum tanaceti]|uniref:Polyamine transport protein n=1 Tax=Colletotrichum tanaceti TaxID=1306861 RepID=A0A4U6X955_9PEZI|nr:hypothetical protein CTA1_11791 [Colletotrichum tanaceti]
MSQARQTRSLTPPTEVQRLTDPNTSAYKQTTLRRYSSAETFGENPSDILISHSPDSPPVAVRIDFCCSSQEDLALDPQLLAKDPEMLSNFFHPTKADKNLQRERSDKTGDFDETPLPSLRPSMADMSLKKVKNDVASSISSTRGGSFRHALLKTSSERPNVIDKDLPVPPVLSRQTSKNHRSGTQDDKGGYEDSLKIAIPSRKYQYTQAHDGSFPIINSQPSESMSNVDQSFSREMVCVDPLIHPDESHIKAHHRGLLKGADFCDAGVPGQPIAQLPDASSSSSSSSSSTSSEAAVVHARIRRAMTGDDLCLSTVEVTVPKHDGHSHATKIRPAFNQPTFNYPIEHQEQKSPLGVSKVRSFDPAKEHMLSERTILQPSVPADDNNESLAAIPVSKVRPFTEESNADTEKHREEYFAIGSDESAMEEVAEVDKSRPSTTPRSRASTIDYKRTAQWIRQLLKTPETHTAKLTEMPSKEKRTHYTALKDSPEHSPISRKITRHTTLPPSDVEPSIFQNTFGELERLLHEALALASQAVDREEAESPNSEQSPRNISNRLAPLTAPDDDAQQFSDIDLTDNKVNTKPATKRAATFPNAARPNQSNVDDLYRNISLTPQTAELENMLGHKIKLHRAVANTKHSDVTSMDGSNDSSNVKNSNQSQVQNRSSGPNRPRASTKRVPFMSRNTGENILPERDAAGRPTHNSRGISLRGKSHVSLRGAQAFSLAKSKRRQPIARDWSPVRKRAIAAVACISTALIGMVIGIYAGLVPSLQYYILDTSHSIINGNVGCFLGMAIPTFFCWPLPLMHGRKPYITTSLVLTMPLLFPQALAVSAQRFYNLTG